VFSKTEYWDQLPSLPSELKREDATARFLRRGFPYGFSRGIPASAYTTKYPIPTSRLDHSRGQTQREKHRGEYRGNGAGKDRDPLQYLPMLETTIKLGVSRQTVLQRVKRGELQAVLVRQGRRKGLRIKVVDQQPELFEQLS
jgi:hypothetical protein